MSTSIYHKVGVASLLMMASVFLSRAMGLFREMLIAYAAGAGASVDAYQIAFVIPEILNHIVASGFLSVTFIPIFSDYLARNEEVEGWRIFSIILAGFGAVLVFFILIAEIFAPDLIRILAPGLKDPVVIDSAVTMTRIILPAQFFFFAGGLFMAVQFAKERFFIPALAPLVYNLGIMAGGVVLGPWLKMHGFAWGVLAGAFVGNFWIQYVGARKAGMRLALVFDFRHPDLKKYVLLTLPLMLGLTMTFSTEIFFKFFGSYLPEGSIAGLNYGLRLMLMLVGLFGQAVGVASFPFMARLAAEGRLGEMNRLLNQTLRYLALVIPLCALFMVLRNEMVVVIFQRGRFDAQATALTASILPYLMIGAFAFAAQTVVVRGFYAVQNTIFPAVFGTIAVALSIPLYVYGMHAMGVRGVALAVSLAALIQITLIYAVWNRRTQNHESRIVYGFVLKMAGLSLCLGVVLEGFRRMFLSGPQMSGFFGSLMSCIVVGSVFGLILLVAAHLLRIEEINDMVRRIANRFGKIFPRRPSV